MTLDQADKELSWVFLSHWRRLKEKKKDPDNKRLRKLKRFYTKVHFTFYFIFLQAPYSIPNVDDYYGEYPTHCNVPGEIFLGGFPLPSPKGIRIYPAKYLQRVGLEPELAWSEGKRAIHTQVTWLGYLLSISF